MEREANILVVDDVAENVKISGNILRENGYKMLAAMNGETALNILNEKHIDLVLLDIAMPGMDGFEVCDRIVKNPETSHIPVIFLTAMTQTEDVVRGFKTGAVDYITKPFQTEELLQRVHTHLRIKQQQETITEQNNQLQELNATKDKFFNIMAHDLKNPFNAILGFAELLLKRHKTISEEKREHFINNIYNNTKNAYKLLENLLEWSRSQTNRIKFSPETVNLATLVNEMLPLIEESAAQKAIQLTNTIEDDIFVNVDKNMINTVLRNLLTNAVKFTPDNGEVSVMSKKHEEDNSMQVTVKDSGVGIEKDKLNDLFRIDKNTTSEGTKSEQGTGLGLILSKEFIEKHGGKIWAESNPGEGSEFHFTLPIQE